MKSGVLQLRSGRWTWQAFELRDLPAGTVEVTYIALRLDGWPDSRMTIRLPGDLGGIDDAGLQLLAKHPWDREARGDGGVLRFIPIRRPGVGQGVGREARPETHTVLYINADGKHRIGELPFEVGLGYATDAELLEVARS